MKINIRDYASVDDALDALYMGAKVEKREEKSKKTKNHYGDGTCYYNGVFPCNGCGECND